MQRGIRRVSPEIEIVSVPLADGGEGTLEAFLTSVGGELLHANVHDPLGRKVSAHWARLSDGSAVIEMAQASGLPLIAPHERDALRASSFGTGELIRAALDAGCRKLLVGVGGSATTDGGSGALRALGARFLHANGEELGAGGAALRDLARIDWSQFDVRVLDCDVRVLCDVTNPLCGEHGAARVYSAQKGATKAQIEILENALSHFADICTRTYFPAHTATSSTRSYPLKDVVADTNGAGAAGGTAFGLMRFLDAQLVSGIETILEVAAFADKLENADLVFTAEGSIDEQTPNGKALAGVAKMARNAKNGAGVAVVAFGGRVALSGQALQEMGIVSAFPLCDGPRTLEYSMSHASELLESAVERALRLWIGASV